MIEPDAKILEVVIVLAEVMLGVVIVLDEVMLGVPLVLTVEETKLDPVVDGILCEVAVLDEETRVEELAVGGLMFRVTGKLPGAKTVPNSS